MGPRAELKAVPDVWVPVGPMTRIWARSEILRSKALFLRKGIALLKLPFWGGK